MQMTGIPFVLTEWAHVERTEHKGETGTRTGKLRPSRIFAFAWSNHARIPGRSLCSKGHVLLCLEGQLDTELKDGRRFTLMPGMSYQVADADPHRSSTATGAKLFIVD